MKYDFEIALEETTSTGKIISYVKDTSKVLEFGPGNGRMTRYLTEEKKCEVSIVEFDPELFSQVSKIAKDGFLGNIEEYKWCDYFEGEQFDAIIFADVLEHLQDPEKALKKAKLFLKENGIILISFPNLAHNSVLIDLFNNKLNYNEYGILDKTHNTFYTEEGFHQLFRKAGLFIHVQDYTYAKVGDNEIESRYEDLPPTVSYYYKMRPFGEVYQYFFVLAKYEADKPLNKLPDNSNAVVQAYLVYDCEGNVEIEPWLMSIATGENTEIIRKMPSNLSALKIVPMQGTGMVKVHFTAENTPIKITNTNAIWCRDNTYTFLNHQPFFRIEDEKLRGKTISLSIDYCYLGEFSKEYKDLIIKSKRQIIFLEKQKEMHSEAIEIYRKHYRKMQHMQSWKAFSKFQNFVNRYNNIQDLKSVKEIFKYRIDNVCYDEKEHNLIIRGWGFSLKDKQALFYSIPVNQGSYFHLTRQDRFDVCDMYDLDRKTKPGFQLVIEDAILQKKYYLKLKSQSGEKGIISFSLHNPNPEKIVKRLYKNLRDIKHEGLKEVLEHKRFKKKNSGADDYDYWIFKYEQVNVQATQQMIEQFNYKPKISVVVPVYNVEEKWLDRCIDSMEKQVYDHWELCLADDCSTKAYVKPLLERYAKKDDRIKVFFRQKNGRIAEATNSAISIATGDYIGFMDNDDELSPMALYEVVKAINQNPKIDFIYTDEDKINTKGKRFDPFFKSNWNPILLQGHNYITHFVVVKKELMNKIGGLRKSMDGSQDYDFVLRATEQAEDICHIPKILYHWRTVETSVAFDPKSKEYAYTAGKRALEETLKRNDIEGTVSMTRNYGAYKIDYVYSEPLPKISVLFTNDNENIQEALRSILTHIDYENFEILLPNAVDGIENEHIKIFGQMDINELAKKSSGEYLLLLSSTLRLTENSKIAELLNYGMNASVGAVGGKTITDENVVYNAGVWIDDRCNQIHYVGQGESNRGLGYYFRNVLPQNVFALTEGCMLIKRDRFLQVDGLDCTMSRDLRGIDLCLKLRQLGYDIVWTPYFECVETDTASRTLSEESFGIFDGKWPVDKRKDPYTNPWITGEES